MFRANDFLLCSSKPNWWISRTPEIVSLSATLISPFAFLTSRNPDADPRAEQQGRGDEERDRDECHQCQGKIDEEHGHEDEGDLQEISRRAHDPVGDELAQRLQVVGEVRERRSHRGPVEIVVRQPEDLSEEVHPQVEQEPLAEVLDAPSGQDREPVRRQGHQHQQDSRAAETRQVPAHDVGVDCVLHQVGLQDAGPVHDHQAGKRAGTQQRVAADVGQKPPQHLRVRRGLHSTAPGVRRLFSICW